MALIGHYRLNDASGTAAVATVGSDGTYVNAPTLGALGPGGTSYIGVKLASASSQTITLPNQAITDPWSVCFYFKSAATTGTLLDFTDGAGDGLAVSLSSGSVSVNINGDVHTSASTQNDGFYHHVAVVYSAEVATIYIDGAADGSTLATTDLAVAAGVTLGSGLDGNLSDVRVYDSALDAAGVLAVYNASQGPVVHYEFDETTGTTCSDISGNSLAGTLAGTTFDASSVASVASGNLGTAIELSGGASNLITMPQAATTPLSGENQPITLSTWAYFDTVPGSVDQYLFMDNATLGIGVQIYVRNNGRFYWNQYGQAAASTRTADATVLSQSTWHMLTFLYDGTVNATGLKIYVDGQEVQSYLATIDGYDTWKTATPTRQMALGALGAAGAFDGRLDDARLYYRALSAQEISDLYDAATVAGTAPTITTTSPLSYNENTAAAIVIQATGDPTPTYAITGGADAALFSITTGGNLSFLTPPDYENPADADTNNAYVVQITATNSEGTDVLDLTINVQDVAGPVNTVAPVISRVS